LTKWQVKEHKEEIDGSVQASSGCWIGCRRDSRMGVKERFE